MTVDMKIIGVDESGKGDFFGPLVIASFLAPDSKRDHLQRIGVKDGKAISDNKILDIDEYLRDNFPYSLKVIMPSEYNREYKKIKNLNKLLAFYHAEVIDSLYKINPANRAISDKFGKSELIENALLKRDCNIDLIQMVRGEAVIQVAAASIIARAGFIRGIQKLSEEIGFELPKGAAPKVDQAGRELVNSQGVEILEKVSKVHFKNYLKITTPTLL